MRRVLSLFSLLLVLAAAGCNRDYREYSDRENRFEVDYPVTWQIRPGEQTGIAVRFESPMEGLSDSFLETFCVTAGDIPGTMNAESFAQATVAAPRSYIPKFRLIEEKPVKLAGGDSFLLSYEGDFAGEKLTWIQYFFVKKGMGYSIVFTLSTPAAKNYAPVIEKVADSFRMK